LGNTLQTAVLITSFLGDLGEKWMIYGFGILVVVSSLVGGLLIVKNLNKK